VSEDNFGRLAGNVSAIDFSGKDICNEYVFTIIRQMDPIGATLVRPRFTGKTCSLKITKRPEGPVRREFDQAVPQVCDNQSTIFQENTVLRPSQRAVRRKQDRISNRPTDRF